MRMLSPWSERSEHQWNRTKIGRKKGRKKELACFGFSRCPSVSFAHSQLLFDPLRIPGEAVVHDVSVL
jgi:hypothetical protein